MKTLNVMDVQFVSGGSNDLDIDFVEIPAGSSIEIATHTHGNITHTMIDVLSPMEIAAPCEETALD